MAELRLEGGELVLRLLGAEKAEAVHGDLRVPLWRFAASRCSTMPRAGPAPRSGCASRPCRRGHCPRPWREDVRRSPWRHAPRREGALGGCPVG